MKLGWVPTRARAALQTATHLRLGNYARQIGQGLWDCGPNQMLYPNQAEIWSFAVARSLMVVCARRTVGLVSHSLRIFTADRCRKYSGFCQPLYTSLQAVRMHGMYVTGVGSGKGLSSCGASSVNEKGQWWEMMGAPVARLVSSGRPLSIVIQF
jgi:hypothetical protein